MLNSFYLNKSQTGVKQGSNRDQTGAILLFEACLVLVQSLYDSILYTTDLKGLFCECQGGNTDFHTRDF